MAAFNTTDREEKLTATTRGNLIQQEKMLFRKKYNNNLSLPPLKIV
jgi:hypothetical protein